MATTTGVVRSRTLLFLSYRDSAARDHHQKQRGSERAEGAYYYDAAGDLHEHRVDVGAQSSAAPQLPPRWIDISDEVDGILATLPSRMEHLDRLHARHILPGFADRSGEEREIEYETSEITKQLRKCSRRIANLAEHTRAASKAGPSSAREIAMANNVQTALATKVQDASVLFRRRQSTYMQRLRGHEERHQNHTALAEERHQGDDAAAAALGADPSMMQLESSMATATAQVSVDIAQRDREIDQIARSIADLAELFQDLSGLVIDQGTMLDRIDFNIEHMGEDMNAAVLELKDATRYQKRTSRGQCILFLVLLIILCLAVIIVKPFWRGSS